MTQYTPEEIAANRAKWLAALRSGKYSQAPGALRQAGGFCCLGVLCDVSDPTRWSGQSYDNRMGYPPRDILVSVGMPYHQMGNITSQVALMNDNGSTFFEIADFLEQEFSQ